MINRDLANQKAIRKWLKLNLHAHDDILTKKVLERNTPQG